MSSADERRKRRLEIQSNSGSGNGRWEKVLDVPESIPKLKLEVMKPVIFDIMPVLIDEKHPDYASIKAFADKYPDETISDWCVPYSMHANLKGVSQHVCRSWGKIGDRKCPTCEARSQALQDGVDPKSEEIKEYNVKNRVALCVCPRGGEQDGEMVLLEGAKSWVFDPIKAVADRENLYLADTSLDGMSIKATPQAFTYTDNKTKEKVTIPGELFIELVPREFAYTDEDIADVLPICDYLNFKSYEEIYTMVHGLTSMPESEEDEEIVDTKPTSGRAGRASTQDVETTSTSTVREPNTSPRRGRGGAPEASEPTSTPRGRARGRGASTETFTEDEITF